MTPMFLLEEENTEKSGSKICDSESDNGISAIVHQKVVMDTMDISLINVCDTSKVDISYCEEQLANTLHLSFSKRSDLRCETRTSKNDVRVSSSISLPIA